MPSDLEAEFMDDLLDRLLSDTPTPVAVPAETAPVSPETETPTH